MQEISLKKVLDNDDESAANGTHQNYNYNGGVSGGGFLSSRVDLDIAMQSLQRDILTDNDDYQLILPDCAGGGAGATNKAQGKPNSSALCVSLWAGRMRKIENIDIEEGNFLFFSRLPHSLLIVAEWL